MKLHALLILFLTSMAMAVEYVTSNKESLKLLEDGGPFPIEKERLDDIIFAGETVADRFGLASGSLDVSSSQLFDEKRTIAETVASLDQGIRFLDDNGVSLSYMVNDEIGGFAGMDDEALVLWVLFKGPEPYTIGDVENAVVTAIHIYIALVQAAYTESTEGVQILVNDVGFDNQVNQYILQQHALEQIRADLQSVQLQLAALGTPGLASDAQASSDEMAKLYQKFDDLAAMISQSSSDPKPASDAVIASGDTAPEGDVAVAPPGGSADSNLPAEAAPDATSENAPPAAPAAPASPAPLSPAIEQASSSLAGDIHTL